MTAAAANKKKEPELVRIKFGPTESGWAQKLSGGKFRIRNIPMDGGWLLDDVVTVRQFEGWDLVDKLVKRVFVGKAYLYYDEEYQFRELCGALKYLGCKVEGLCGNSDGDQGVMSVVYPNGVSPAKVAKKLGVSQKKR
jgi:hypothetical protein